MNLNWNSILGLIAVNMAQCEGLQSSNEGSSCTENPMQIFCFVGLWYSRVNSFTTDLVDPYLCNTIILAYLEVEEDEKNGWRLIFVKNNVEESSERQVMTRSIIQASGKRNTQFLISIGGYGDFNRSKYKKLSTESAALDSFMRILVGFLEENNLDGMDFFWNFIGRDDHRVNPGLVKPDLQDLEGITRNICRRLKQKGYLCSVTLRGAEFGSDDPVKRQAIRNIVSLADVVHLWTADIMTPRLMPDDMLLLRNATADPDYRFTINYIVDYVKGALEDDPMLWRKLSMVIPMQWATYGLEVGAEPTYGSMKRVPSDAVPNKFQFPYSEICKGLIRQGEPGENFDLKMLQHGSDNYTVAFSRNYRFSGEGVAIPMITNEDLKRRVDYARSQGLASLSVFQIAADDVHGHCYNQTFPMLNALQDVLGQCRLY